MLCFFLDLSLTVFLVTVTCNNKYKVNGPLIQELSLFFIVLYRFSMKDRKVSNDHVLHDSGYYLD